MPSPGGPSRDPLAAVFTLSNHDNNNNNNDDNDNDDNNNNTYIYIYIHMSVLNLNDSDHNHNNRSSTDPAVATPPVAELRSPVFIHTTVGLLLIV